MKRRSIYLVASAVLAFSGFIASPAFAFGPNVSVTVQGALVPGVYGRIDLGNATPPPLIYAQPVIIQQPAVLVQQQPLYLHVPPGHAKKWSKHCGAYNACGHPVYFVRVNGDDEYGRDSYKRRDYERGRGDDDRDDDDRRERGHGKGKKDKHNKHD
jgi:hypothetical protein